MGIEELRAARYWTAAQGKRAVALWRKSGEPLAVFAERTGLRRPRLQYWINQGSPPSPAAVVLAPVTVRQAPRSSALSIELRSGRVIHIEDDFDDAVLARVIAIAEHAC